MRVIKLIVTLLISTSTFLFPSQYCAADSKSLPSVGMLIPLSGNYATVGTDNRQGAEIALAELGAKAKFRLTYEDSKADPTTSVSIFRSLVRNGSISAFAMRSPVGMAINPISQSLHIPIIGGVGHKDFTANNEYAFQAWSSSDFEGAFLANHLLAKNFKRIAVITSQDEWLVSVTAGFNATLINKNNTPVFNEELLPSDADFRSVLSRIQRLKPDCIFVNLALAQIGPFLKQAQELKISSALYSNFWLPKKGVVDAAGDAIEGVRFAEMDTNLPNLRKALENQFKSIPSGATLASYVSVLLLNQAMSGEPDIKDAQSLYKALLKQSELVTADRVYKISKRQIQFPMTVKVMRSGAATEDIL